LQRKWHKTGGYFCCNLCSGFCEAFSTLYLLLIICLSLHILINFCRWYHLSWSFTSVSLQQSSRSCQTSRKTAGMIIIVVSLHQCFVCVLSSPVLSILSPCLSPTCCYISRGLLQHCSLALGRPLLMNYKVCWMPVLLVAWEVLTCCTLNYIGLMWYSQSSSNSMSQFIDVDNTVSDWLLHVCLGAHYTRYLRSVSLQVLVIPSHQHSTFCCWAFQFPLPTWGSGIHCWRSPSYWTPQTVLDAAWNFPSLVLLVHIAY